MRSRTHVVLALSVISLAMASPSAAEKLTPRDYERIEGYVLSGELSRARAEIGRLSSRTTDVDHLFRLDVILMRLAAQDGGAHAVSLQLRAILGHYSHNAAYVTTAITQFTRITLSMDQPETVRAELRALQSSIPFESLRDSYLRLAIYSFGRDRYSEALAVMEEMKRTDPTLMESERWLLQYANILSASERWDEAAAYFEAIIANSEDLAMLAMALFERANVHLRVGETDAAIARLERVVKLDDPGMHTVETKLAAARTLRHIAERNSN